MDMSKAILRVDRVMVSVDEDGNMRTEVEEKDFGSLLFVLVDRFNPPKNRMETEKERMEAIWERAKILANLLEKYRVANDTNSELPADVQQAIDDETLSLLSIAENYADLCNFAIHCEDGEFTQKIIGDVVIQSAVRYWEKDKTYETSPRMVLAFSWGDGARHS